MIALMLTLSLLTQSPGAASQPAPAPATPPAAPAGASQPAIDFAPLTEALEHFVDACELPGGGMIIMRGDEVLYEEYVGSYSAETVVMIASASKWLSGATIMALVDEKKIDLDAPISTYLPKFTGEKGTITVRQLFSLTSGLPPEHDAVHNHRITLEQAVDAIAEADLVSTPGSEFRYGGVSMHVAARIAEVVTGKSWHEVFNKKITRPLGMSSTRFGLGLTKNPSPAGGARSTLRDYTRFLRMIARGGELDGVRVLSNEAVDILLADQTQGNPMRGAVARRVAGARYGIGNWVNQVDRKGRSVVNSSPGAFGFTPWIDRDRNILGIFVIEDTRSARKRVANLPDMRLVTNALLDGEAPPASQPAASQPAPAERGTQRDRRKIRPRTEGR